MITVISNVSAFTYKRIIKPVIFTQKPDSVHEVLVALGGRLQKFSFMRWLLVKTWAYNNTPFLEQQILGITFKNPVGLSAGFDKNFELPLLLKSVGFGFMEGGSITAQPCPGNPKPWFYRLPKTKSIVVYAGLANHGVKTILARLKKYPTNQLADFPLNISVAKTNCKITVDDKGAVADYIASLVEIKQSGLGDMITLNISCPNTYGGEPFTSPKRLELLLKDVDSLALTLPVFIKMPSDLSWGEFDKLLAVAAKHNIAGVTICNLAKDRSKVTLLDELPAHVRGNLSGKPTWELSNDLIRRTYKKYGKQFVIIGVGGVFSAEDAYTKIKLGATLVELITGLIFEGPQVIGQINKGLAHKLKQDGYTSVNQAIGVDA